MLIDIIDPTNGKIIGVADRKKIHKSGDWHVAVHGNIIRNHQGSMQILVQKRSDKVDIAKNYFDQSVAIQAISGERNLDNILLRGLKEELGLKKEDVEFVRFNKNGKLLIEKKYEYDKSLKNNEKAHLYLIKTFKNPKPVSERVRTVEWMDWLDFIQLSHRKNCTKSVRMYTHENRLRKSLEKAMFQFLSFGKIDEEKIYKGLRSFSTDEFYDL